MWTLVHTWLIMAKPYWWTFFKLKRTVNWNILDVQDSQTLFQMVWGTRSHACAYTYTNHMLSTIISGAVYRCIRTCPLCVPTILRVQPIRLFVWFQVVSTNFRRQKYCTFAHQWAFVVRRVYVFFSFFVPFYCLFTRTLWRPVELLNARARIYLWTREHRGNSVDK